MDESEPKMENTEDTEEFTVIDPSEINSEYKLFQDQDDAIESVMEKFDGLQLELSQTDIDEVMTELRQLEELRRRRRYIKFVPFTWCRCMVESVIIGR